MKNAHKLYGYASIFHNIDADGDIISPLAYNDTSFQNIPVFWEHNNHYQIGELYSHHCDNYGLYVCLVLYEDHELYQCVISSIQNGIMKNLSIGYKVIESRRLEHNNVRYITKLDLHEISIVKIASSSQCVIQRIE